MLIVILKQVHVSLYINIIKANIVMDNMRAYEFYVTI